jgi:hypothetical protein
MLPAAGAAPAAADPTTYDSPRDLPYYDIKWAKALSLSDMNVLVTRDQQDGYDILTVEFAAFDQPFATPKGVQNIRWRQRAVLVLPPAALKAGPNVANKALAYNVHDVPFGEKTSPRSYVGINLSIAKAFGIPVMVHGWVPDFMKEIVGESYHGTQETIMRALLKAGIESAKDMPWDGRYLFNGNPLVKGDMVALTLLQRLVKQERGTDVTELASMGNSKEGASHWTLGAVDDRIKVLAPGGCYWQDTAGILDHYSKDLNWRMPWKSAREPAYGSVDDLFNTFYKYADWITSTEAGSVMARTTTDSVNWYDKIYAKHLVVFGDIGLVPGQHDGPWPFWAENEPLSKMKHPSWRYVRIYDADGTLMYEKGIGEMGLSLLPQMADLLINDAVLPGKPTVELSEVAARQIRVTASAPFTAGLEQEVVVVYAISPERGLRDAEYWHIATAQKSKAGTWEAVLPTVPQGQGLTVIVVARERAKAGELSYWRSASTLPVERFPVPQFNSPPGPDWRE